MAEVIPAEIPRVQNNSELGGCMVCEPGGLGITSVMFYSALGSSLLLVMSMMSSSYRWMRILKSCSSSTPNP